METVVEILIDFSGSMGDKILLTKRMLLENIIPSLDFASRIGIKTFAQHGDSLKIDSILPLEITNKEEIEKAISSLGTPNGNTPIGKAIKNSVNALRDYVAYDKRIILVTDGEENTGGDYVAEAARANEEGINCAIHIIGIGLNETAKAQAQEISKLTSGSFSSIDFQKDQTTYNSAIITSSLSNFINRIKRGTDQTSVSVISNAANKPTAEQPIVSSTIAESSHIEVGRSIQQGAGGGDVTRVLDLLIQEIQEMKAQMRDLRSGRPEVEEEIEDEDLMKKIGRKSEQYLFNVLNKKYPDRVRWLNEKEESGKNHDFEIFELDEKIEYYIECKGTTQGNSTFYMTKAEWMLFLNHTKNYQIYFVRNSLTDPSHIFIDNLLDWLLRGKVVPYLKQKKVVKEDRVFLTLSSSVLDD